MVARAKSSEPRRIPVVLPTWLSDIGLATAAMRAIRLRFPAAHVAFLVEANARPVIESCGWMDEGLATQIRRKGFE